MFASKWTVGCASAALLLALPAACGNSSDEFTSEVVPGSGDYGEERIGYRSAQGALQEGSNPGDVNYDAASGDGDGSVDWAQGSGGTTASGGSGTGGLGDAGALNVGGSAPQESRRPIVTQADDEPLPENPFFSTGEETTSTFSIDVDGGSYSFARAALASGSLPRPEAVRVEEFLNYFHFHYEQPSGNEPLSLYTEWSKCPWNEERDLLLLGVQGQEVALEDQPPLNLVYLLDVSGSMSQPLKLPLLKKGFRLLTSLLRPQDRVSIVTYAGADRVVLEGASGDQKEQILNALSDLEAGGSTNGQGGIQKAYEIAQQHFIEGGSNRVLLATDGDFNVGLSEVSALVDFIAEKRDTGVFLSVYGYGGTYSGTNYRDEVGEQLADNGNGIYFYIDGEEETRRAFGYTMSGTLMTVAKDVKLQLEFNPRFVKGYRLIGYENRVLSNASFDDDSVDAGELSAGLSVTALYEIIPAQSTESLPSPLPGTIPEVLTEQGDDQAPEDDTYGPPLPSQMAQIRLRYKDSDADESKVFRMAIEGEDRRDAATRKFYFAAGISEFAMQLRGSQYLNRKSEGALSQQLSQGLPLDTEGAVREAIDLFEKSLTL